MHTNTFTFKHARHSMFNSILPHWGARAWACLNIKSGDVPAEMLSASVRLLMGALSAWVFVCVCMAGCISLSIVEYECILYVCVRARVCECTMRHVTIKGKHARRRRRRRCTLSSPSAEVFVDVATHLPWTIFDFLRATSEEREDIFSGCQCYANADGQRCGRVGYK